MRRYLVDSMIFDRIIETEGAAELVERLTDQGTLALVATHIQDDEHAEIRKREKAAAIAGVPRENVPTYGFILGTSRLGMARLSEEEPIESLRGANWSNYTHDALIAATAQFAGIPLVTDDRRLARRAGDRGIEILGWEKFHKRLLELSGPQ
jgi:predicted nucleic acid-binding protein